MQLDKDTLLKHRFWILLGLAIPIIIVVVILVPTTVGGETETKRKKVESTITSLNLPDPKNDKWIEGLGGKEKTLDDKRKEVWKAAWDAQASLYDWPKALDSLRSAAFGDPIDRYLCGLYVRNRSAISQAQEILKIIQPVNAKGEGTVLLRNQYPIQTISKFRREEPAAEELWLAQEDLWVQRELLQIVRDANDSVARFRVLPNLAAGAVLGPAGYYDRYDRNDKGAVVPINRYWPPLQKGEIRQQFYNPYWELDLSLTRTAKNDPVVRGTIKNISQRKLPLGIQLHIRVKPPVGQMRSDVGLATLFVDGEPVPAGAKVDIKESTSLVQAAPDGLFGVEQVFTWRTAPVKRLDAMALYKSSHRTAHIALKPAPQFAAADKPPEGAPPGGPGSAPGRIQSTGDPGGGGETQIPQPGGPSSLLGPGGAAGAGRITESGLRKDRYIHVTEQVRRMPVALTVTVDQNHLPNVIAAFSNSRLRMQVTQVHLIHVRGDSLRPPETGGLSGGDEGGQPTKPGFPRFPGGGELGSPDEGGRPQVIPPAIGFPGGGGLQGTGGSLFPTSAADEDEGNLVELTVYAIASLYERYRDKPATPPGGAQPPGPGGEVPGKPPVDKP